MALGICLFAESINFVAFFQDNLLLFKKLTIISGSIFALLILWYGISLFALKSKGVKAETGSDTFTESVMANNKAVMANNKVREEIPAQEDERERDVWKTLLKEGDVGKSDIDSPWELESLVGKQQKGFSSEQIPSAAPEPVKELSLDIEDPWKNLLQALVKKEKSSDEQEKHEDVDSLKNQPIEEVVLELDEDQKEYKKRKKRKKHNQKDGEVSPGGDT